MTAAITMVVDFHHSFLESLRSDSRCGLYGCPNVGGLDIAAHGYLSCQTGTRPAVHGAPTVSSDLSSLARSTSVRDFNFASAALNSSAAMPYCSCCDWLGRNAERRMR